MKQQVHIPDALERAKMKPNFRHELFVTEMIRHGDSQRAYQAAYPDASGESLRTAANRLLHTPAIATRINEAYSFMRFELAAKEAEAIQADLESIQQKRDILRNIYTGENVVQKTISSRTYEVRHIDVYPSNQEILKAIHMDNLLADKQMELRAFRADITITADDDTQGGQFHQQIVTNESEPLVVPEEKQMTESVTICNNHSSHSNHDPIIVQIDENDIKSVTIERSELVTTNENDSKTVTNCNNSPAAMSDQHVTPSLGGSRREAKHPHFMHRVKGRERNNVHAAV